jgi:hypothetical protein
MPAHPSSFIGEQSHARVQPAGARKPRPAVSAPRDACAGDGPYRGLSAILLRVAAGTSDAPDLASRGIQGRGDAASGAESVRQAALVNAHRAPQSHQTQITEVRQQRWLVWNQTSLALYLTAKLLILELAHSKPAIWSVILSLILARHRAAGDRVRGGLLTGVKVTRVKRTVPLPMAQSKSHRSGASWAPTSSPRIHAPRQARRKSRKS